jgi:phosphocarrier protein
MDFDSDCPEPELPEGVLRRDLTIQNRKGLHARATAKFVQTVDRFEAEFWVAHCGEVVGGRSIMALLTLGAGIGRTITVAARGDDAQAALDAVAALVNDKFGEGE